MINCDRKIIAIDGCSGSGKSTLAKFLQKHYNDCDKQCDIIHMDHFFLPPNLRTEDRLKEIGGNIHYERFTKEVLSNLNTNRNFYYNKYDCSKMSICDKVEISCDSQAIIIEGVYSLHPIFIDYSNIKIFMCTDSESQSWRILERNGPQIHKQFINNWIPMENLYFSKMNIRSKCDFFLET